MEKKEKNRTVNKLITGIGGLVALVPGLSQLKKIDMLPEYWNNSNLVAGVLTSVISFVTVLILYSYRKDFAETSRKKIVRSTVIIFCLFLVAVITYSILSINCLIKDQQERVAFIPIILSSELSQKVNSQQVGGRELWVHDDGAVSVHDEISESERGNFNLQLTMIIFLLLYLGIFILLISSSLLLGFHLSPEIDEGDKKKDKDKEKDQGDDKEKDNNAGSS